MNILGVSALYHDSSATLVRDGCVIAAVQEERFSRIKHDKNIPYNAIKYCLAEGAIDINQVDAIIYYDNPILTLDRYLMNIYYSGNDNEELLASIDSVLQDKVWIHKRIQNLFISKMGSGKEQIDFLVLDHHMSHAASAFYPSPFNDAIILTVDGVGEWETTTIGVGSGADIKILESLHYPHSLGLMYSAFTYYCGFKVNSGDYKFMGLAPYGEPVYYELIKEIIINVKEDGSFRLNLEYFDFQHARTMVSKKFEVLFGGPRRKPESRITQKEMDIAASVQKITEEILIKIVHYAKKKYGSTTENLCLAGGVALNCVANGKIYNEKIFNNIWIQPAAGDAGGSLGAALYAWYHYDHVSKRIYMNAMRNRDCSLNVQLGSNLGNSYNEREIKEFLNANDYTYEKSSYPEVCKTIANLLADNKIIGLFHGRMEFGPRALGNRSIIANPCSEEMQVKLNMKIKYRESFRPFAPSVIREKVSDYFEFEDDSPYMLIVQDVVKSRRIKQDIIKELRDNNYDMLKVVRKKRSDIPAVTHVDYSARIQTVKKADNEYYYTVLEEFEKLTGCAVVVNTSFNVRGEPIVCSLKDAYNCFMRTDMDVLVLENYILYKKDQKNWKESENWKSKYMLD